LGLGTDSNCVGRIRSMSNNLNLSPPSIRGRTILLDLNGEVILETGYEDFMVFEPDGSCTQHKITSNIQLVDGLQWNPSMLMSKPPILVGVCTDCRIHRFDFVSLRRKPVTHGIVSLNQSRTCDGCGKLCCPHHYKHCSDQKWRCRSCAFKFRIKRLFLSILFVWEDE